MKPRFFHHRNQALTKIEVLVIVAVLAVLAALFLPALAAAKRKSSRIGCMGNIKQIGIAFRIWEGDHGDKYPMAVSVTNGGAMELVATGNVVAYFQVLSNELSTPKILLCPNDTLRLWATNFSTLKNSNISYFVNPDAVETYPQMILDGDDNLQIDGRPVQPGILTLWANSHIGWTKDRHHGAGNIGFADGHAEQVTSHGLNATIAGSIATNRLVIP